MFSCKDDDFNLNENGNENLITENKINLKTFKENITKDKFNRSFLSRSQNQTMNRMIDYHGLLINTDEILSIEYEGHTTYTFNVRETGNNQDLINLVIDEWEDGTLEEKLVVYRNYFSTNATDDLLIIKLDETTNAIAARLVDVSRDMRCYVGDTICNHGVRRHSEANSGPGSGHTCTAWYWQLFETICPPTFVWIPEHQYDEILPSEENNTGGAGGFFYLRTDCMQRGYSSSGDNNQNNNLLPNEPGLFNNTGKSLTKKFTLPLPTESVGLTEAQQFILENHPTLNNFLNSYMSDNPGSEYFIPWFMNYLIGDIRAQGEEEYENFICTTEFADEDVWGDIEQQFENYILKTKIDPSLNNTDIKCILEKMIDAENDENGEPNFFKKMLLMFDSNNYPDINFKYDQNLSAEDGQIFGNTRSYDNGNTYIITFGPDLENKPNLIIKSTVIHEMVHVFILNDLIDTELLFWESNGTASLSFNSPDICNANNNFYSEDKKEYFAYLICKHLELVDDPQWLHELFNMGAFDLSTYRERIEDYLVEHHNWNSESTNWKNLMEAQFGTDWKEVVSLYVAMDALRGTSDFQAWWPYSLSTFNEVMYFIENGHYPNNNDLVFYHSANSNCN